MAVNLKVPKTIDWVRGLQAQARSAPFVSLEDTQAHEILSEYVCPEIIEALEFSEKYRWIDLSKEPDNKPKFGERVFASDGKAFYVVVCSGYIPSYMRYWMRIPPIQARGQ